jgi:hypothetical protein
MKLRADHIAGAAFVLFGIGIFALSGDLPSGQLSMPGSGFLPKIVAGFTIVFGLLLMVRAGESPALTEVDWGGGKHAMLVTAIAAIAIFFYTQFGFIVTMATMMVALLLIIERQNPIRAVAYSLGVVLVTYAGFVYLLKTPLPEFSF